MDRTREARRVTMAVSASTNGLARRRHRSSSLRDSPEDEGPVELQETARLRDRKKDRDRERERERDRERDRERERERERDRLSRTSKRRRGDRLLSNREDGGDDSSEESVSDDEDDDEEDGGGTFGGGSVRMLPQNNTSGSLPMSNHHHHQQQHQHRKSFPPPVKVIRTTPPAGTTMTTTMTTSSTWKAADEMIGVSVPRKARSASIKRSHEWASSGGGVGVITGEQIHRQASTSPVRTGVAGMSTSPSPALPCPSSSNASMRKKMKPNGSKQRPPKSSSKSSSSAQEEIEIEIAEVLYGLMRQPQVPFPSKQDIIGNDSVKFDSREVNKSNNDSKSRVSSPINNSPSTLPQSSSILPSNTNSSATPMSAIAPKRKRPRPVKYEDETTIFPVRNSSISSTTTTKVEIDQPTKIEATSPNLEKNSGPVAENGSSSYDLVNSSQAGPASLLVQAEAVKEEKNNLVPESKPLIEESESRDIGISKKEESQSPKESSPSPANNPSTGLQLDDERENLTVTKANSTVCEIEGQREEKFQIDLMALPPSRSSPERDGEIDFVSSDPKPVATDMELEMKSMVKDDDKRVKIRKEDVNVEAEDNNNKAKPIAEEAESHKPVVNKVRNIGLQLDLEKSDRDSGTVIVSANKLNHHVQKLQQHQQPSMEKTAQSGSLPLPMSMASWPGGLPPMGYMAPLQGVVSMDGSAVSSAAIQPPHLLFAQPRPKRCATHCYIARNIHYHQQFMKMNPFWPAAHGSDSLYGPKACNLNVVPPSELNGNVPGRGVNSVQDKGQGLAIFPGHVAKDKGSQANMVDAAQRKQILLHQALPPGAPSNILHGPAFIFPVSQQQAAASVRPGSVKSPPAAGSTASLNTSNSASVSATLAGATAAPAMSFNYPNMPGNETQYLAILQNNAYPFPIPAHVGAPPAYRGNLAQSMPYIHGSFYSSQMLHPSQLQQQQQHHHHQQQQQKQPPTQLQQSQQGHQNTSMSSGSSSSPKHLQDHQQRPHGSGVSSGDGNLQVFSAPKNLSHHPLQLHQRQQQPSQHASHQTRQEGELGGEDSPSTADSRVSCANMNIYGQNFAMPIQPPNFALMTAASMGGSMSYGGNHGEKKQQKQQPSQQPGLKAGVEPLTSQAFAMSFASINGTSAPGFDISSFAQNTRQGYHQIMAAAAAAQAAQQKKNNYHDSEEGKRGTNDASIVEEERKSKAGKSFATVGQSIAFSRSDLSESAVSTIPGNNVIDSSARTINLGSASARTSGSVMPVSISGINAPNAQQQLQRNQQQQQQQMLQLQKPHQFGAASAARSKTPATSNGSAYSDHLPSSSMATKFPNALSAFPQNLVQSSSSSSPAQSPQWKNSVRTTTSQVPSPSLSSSTSSSLKNISQQQGRPQQSHNQISFAANPKSTQGQPPSSTQSPSPPMMVGSPTTSISRSAGGSPRTAGSTSSGNKGGQASSLASQQAKNSPSVPSQKSSPVGGRSVPSVLGNPHISSSSNTGTKPQATALQQQQKHALHQAQLFFSNAYIPAQAQHSQSTTANGTAASGYYLQRHRNEQQLTQPPGSSTSMLCSPVTLGNSGTTDPSKAVVAAAAAGNMKGGGLASQGLIHAAQFATTQSSGKPHQHLVPGFPYVHAVPAAVQVKPAEPKKPTGE